MLTGHFKMPPIESNTQFQSDVPLQPLNQQQQNLLPTMGKKNFSYSSLVAAARSRRAPPLPPRPPPPSPRPSSPARSTVVKSSKTPTTTTTKTTNTTSNSIVSYNDSFLCYVHDENLAGPAHSPLKRFRALVQVGSDAMRIIHHPPPPPPPLLDRKGKKEKETKASKRFKAAPFPYLLKPGIGLVHDVSYRGVELLQRHKNQFTFSGVRAPITIQLACLEDTERMRRLLTGLYKAKGLGGDHHQALSPSSSPSSTFRHHPLPVFALVSEWQLAEVLDQCSLKLFRWSNQSFGGGGGAPEVAGRSAWLMEFWINRHFVQDALAPMSFCPRSFDAWQHDQQILLKALVKVARIVRLHLEEKRSSSSTLGRNQRQQQQQQLVSSSESSKLKSLTAAAVERLCSGGEEGEEEDENQEEEEEESELLQSSEEYPEKFNPFAADGGGGGKNSEDHVVFQKSHLNSWSDEGETKWATMSAGKQVFDCIFHRFIKLIRKCSIVFTTKEQKKSET